MAVHQDRASNHAEKPIRARRVRGLLAEPGKRGDEIEQFRTIEVGPCLAIGLSAGKECRSCGAQRDARSMKRGDQYISSV